MRNLRYDADDGMNVEIYRLYQLAAQAIVNKMRTASGCEPPNDVHVSQTIAPKTIALK